MWDLHRRTGKAREHTGNSQNAAIPAERQSSTVFSLAKRTVNTLVQTSTAAGKRNSARCSIDSIWSLRNSSRGISIAPN